MMDSKGGAVALASRASADEDDAGAPSRPEDTTGDDVGALRTPYLLFLGDCTEAGYAKTAFGLRDWAGDKCLGESVLPGATVSTGLTRLSPAEAAERGAKSMVIGIANSGGRIAPDWMPALEEALAAGLDIVSGMHARLADLPGMRAAAEKYGQRLVDIRTPPADLPVATGRKRSGRRLLTVGTDCALGKKYTALSIARALAARGVDSDFRATGQTGILIAGAGIALDSVVADFAAGAAELLSPDNAADHWDIVEGQGSLYHPAYSGVSMALLHGSQPDVFVICHDPARRHVLGHPDFPLPEIEELAELTIRLGGRTNPAIRCAGVSLNTSTLGPDEANDLLARETARLGMPVADPIRGGESFDTLVESCLAE
ncbi:DUF1611 domain-containing protein [Alteriqipengyuania lutimaris]|uniref:DUF1611 domain-containing protein n=1 Tax=Alteriqipengyuania lutimaris TaxID=1538146 RepID=A0A395LN04_9SPHN|nr:DUF1611 domain-containing protein [Alteriqipengyuania lutimaris]MBB3032436.1 putative NAD-dependent epimerase/dehydratase family protein [Alteriqipengyuania lutimaris]RDS78423.1 DUF1611 domain-containing protein [Alteriqipengyuania lutimaris]